MIKDNGFLVNTENGECMNEVYFRTYTDGEFTREKMNSNVDRIFSSKVNNTRIGMAGFWEDSNWKRLYRMDENLNVQRKTMSKQKVYFRDAMNEFNLSEELRTVLFKDVFIHKPKKLEETMGYLFESIQNNNVQVRTSEFIKFIKKNFRNKRTIILKSLKWRKRDYFWIVTEILSDIKKLTTEQKARIESITIKNFNILKKDFTMPIVLLGTLTRMAVSKYFSERSIPPMKLFRVSGSAFYRIRKKIMDIVGSK